MLTRRLFLQGLSAALVASKKSIFIFDSHYHIDKKYVKFTMYPPMLEQDTGKIFKAVYWQPEHLRIGWPGQAGNVGFYSFKADADRYSRAYLERETIANISRYIEEGLRDGSLRYKSF